MVLSENKRGQSSQLVSQGQSLCRFGLGLVLVNAPGFWKLGEQKSISLKQGQDEGEASEA